MFWNNIALTVADAATNISVTPQPVPVGSDQMSSMGWSGISPQQDGLQNSHSCVIRGVQVAGDHKGIHTALKRLEGLQVLMPCSHLTPFPVWKW